MTSDDLLDGFEVQSSLSESRVNWFGRHAMSREYSLDNGRTESDAVSLAEFRLQDLARLVLGKRAE